MDVELLKSKKCVFHITWFEDEGVWPLTAMEGRGDRTVPEPIAIKACKKDHISGFHKWDTWK